MNRQKLAAVIFMTCVCLLLSKGADARVSSLTGSISIREGYDSNIYRTKNNEESGMTTTISPALQFNSQGEYDNLSLAYSPGFSFDHKTDENDIDHHFDLRGEKKFSKVFQASLRESFVQSTNTYIESELLQVDGTRLIREYNITDRLWTNTVIVQMDYEYAMGSFFTLKYANYILNQQSPTADDYIRNTPQATLTYLINHKWDFEIFYIYINGDFDIAPDLTTHNPGIRLNYHHTLHTTFFGDYSLRDTSYSGNSQEDYKIHAVSLGLDHEFNPETRLSLAAGASKVDRSFYKDDNGFNATMNLTKTTQKGSMSILGQAGFDESNFSGNDKGLSHYWSVRCSFARQLTERSDLNVYAGMRDDEYKQGNTNNDEQAYYGGGTISFAFARWYTVSLGYNYNQVEADDPTSEYSEYIDHRIYLALAAAKEFWRW